MLDSARIFQEGARKRERDRERERVKNPQQLIIKRVGERLRNAGMDFWEAGSLKLIRQK